MLTIMDRLHYLDDILDSYGGKDIHDLTHVLNSSIDNEENSYMSKSPYYTIESVSTALKENKGNFTILSMNAQSIRAKFSELQIAINQLSESNSTIDVICIQESWLDSADDLSSLQLDGYACISQGYSCSRHGGLMIFVKSNYKYRIIEQVNNSTIWEGLFCEITDETGHFSLIVGDIYKPPRQNNNNENIQQFLDELQPVVEKIDKLNKNIFLAGDYNIDLLKINERELFAEFLDRMIHNSIFPQITLPTRFSTHSCTLLDNIFCKISDHIKDITSGIILTAISDHLPCFVNVKLQNNICKQPPKRVKQKINTEKAMQSLISDLSKLDIHNKMIHSVEHDPNENYAILSNIIKQHKERHFATRLVKFNKKRHKTNSWITYGLIKSINKRDSIYRQLKKTKPDDQLYDEKKQNLALYNSILKKAIREQKCVFYDNLFNTYKSDIKKTWKSISEILNKTNRRVNKIEKIVKNNNVVTDKNEIADSFNEFFANIGPLLASKIDINNKKPYTSYLKRVISSEFNFATVDSDYVLKIIKSLRTKDSKGHDGISTKMLKSLAPVLLEPITLIINQSLATGIFPTDLKIAKVIPLHKKDSTEKLDNYRPVSLLTAMSKVFEKVAHIQLNQYFKDNNLFYSSQFGFRDDHSTELAALELVDRIHIDLDKKKLPMAIYMDLSKAFDTLDHAILLDKLNHYGIKNNELSWFESYLSQRKQYVEINGVKSDILTLQTGVPQGSILGPLLFLIYMNDIPESSEIFDFILYADDTSLLNSINLSIPLSQDVKIINKELSKIFDWLSVNKLSLNVKKTKYMLFHHHRKNLPNNMKIEINGIDIERVENFDFLGLTLNENLSWKPHVCKISNKITKCIGILNRLKKFLPQHILRLIYCSMVQSHMMYAILCWGFDCGRLEKLQKNLYGL